VNMVGSHFQSQNIPPLLRCQSLKYFPATFGDISGQNLAPPLRNKDKVVVQEKFDVIMGFIVVLGEHGNLVDKLLDIYNCS
jgi:hypothetical protein